MDAAEANQAFTALLDRSLPSNVKLASWCPTMDLLALATHDGQLHLHRLNWQKLWWFAPEAQITALAWRPDGKQLAVGTDEGTVLLLNAEDGVVQHEKNIFPEGYVTITSMYWSAADNTNESTSTTTTTDRARRYFQPPPPEGSKLPSPVAQGLGYSRLEGLTEPRSWPAQPKQLMTLACVSAGGRLHLSTAALFELADINLLTVLLNQSEEEAQEPQEVLTVHRVCMNSNLKEIAIVWSAEDKLHMSRLDTSSALTAHAGRLHWLALCASELTLTIQTCESAFGEAIASWQGARNSFQETFSSLDLLLMQHGIKDVDAKADLTLLVTMGEYSAAMEQFMSSKLGESGLKQIARTMDTAVCSVHNIFVERVQPLVEILAFRLGELRGFAAAGRQAGGTSNNHSSLGLSVGDIGFAERLALQLLVQCEAFRVRLVAVGAMYRTFFSWFLTALRRLPDDTVDTLMGYPLSHVDVVQKFLMDEFLDDSILPWLRGGVARTAACANSLSSAPGSAPTGYTLSHALAPSEAFRQDWDDGNTLKADEQAHILFLISSLEAQFDINNDNTNAALASRAEEMNPKYRRNLFQEILQIKERCEIILGQTSMVLSPQVSVIDQSELGPTHGDCLTAVALSQSSTSKASFVACIAWNVQGKSCATSLHGSSSLGGVGFPVGTKIIDIAMYKEDALVVLLSSNDYSSMVMIPQSSLHQHSTSDTSKELWSFACSCVSEHVFDGNGDQEGLRRRVFIDLPATVDAPLAVSSSRGVGCVLFNGGVQRLLLLDLEEDEAGDDEDDEEMEAADD